jgi:hypothetical protein
MPTHVWIIVTLTAAVLAGFATLLLKRPPRSRKSEPLPQEWPLVQRAIFSPEERALYRQLRTALPHHTVLAKLPLVRFCQPKDRGTLRYWFNLLGPIHVSFVVCSDSGAILAALDIERPTRPTPKRVAAIKQSVLDACRIRYVVCRSDQLPSAAELQMLVPTIGDALRPGVPSSLRDPATGRRSSLAHATRGRAGQAGTESQWYDSGFSQDSFFAPDTQRDALAETPTGQPDRQGLRVVAGQWAGSPSARRPEDFGRSEDTAGHIIGRH